MKANTFTSEAIVLWRKKRKYYSIYAFLTKLEGIILCSVPHKRKSNYKEGAFLQPLSRLYLTVSPNGDMYDIIQIDGISTRDYESLEDISYATFSGELVSALFEKDTLDRGVYANMSRFLQAIQDKPVRLGSIVLGWHMLSIAGFVPQGQHCKEPEAMASLCDEIYETCQYVVKQDLQQAITLILNYDWIPTKPLRLNATQWDQLEILLQKILTYQLGYNLHSIEFLETMI